MRNQIHTNLLIIIMVVVIMIVLLLLNANTNFLVLVFGKGVKKGEAERVRKFVVIGHRGMGMNMLHSPDPRMKFLKENSILSFNAAAQFPIHFLEFDVQVSPHCFLISSLLITNFKQSHHKTFSFLFSSLPFLFFCCINTHDYEHPCKEHVGLTALLLIFSFLIMFCFLCCCGL